MDTATKGRIEQLEAKADALMNRVASLEGSLEGKPAAKKSRKQTSDYPEVGSLTTDDDSKKQHP